MSNTERTIDCTYPYHEPGGALSFEVIRYRPKGFSQRRLAEDGSWVPGTGNLDLLYRLNEILASTQQLVWICEGEKDCDVLNIHEDPEWGAGYHVLSTTNPGGASAWRQAHANWLKERNVVVVPDNDEAGRKWAIKVEYTLRGVALNTRVVWLPGLPAHGDLTDYLGNHDLMDLWREMCKVKPIESWRLITEPEQQAVQYDQDRLSYLQPPRNQAYLKTIKGAVDLVGLVQKDNLGLRQEGMGRWRAHCPFHEDSTPSLVVDHVRYRCFGCGAHGDAFDWWRERHGGTFQQAVQAVAELSGALVYIPKGPDWMHAREDKRTAVWERFPV